MKWIGQQVYDFISRFRNEVYLEDVSSGTIASGGHLGLDSNNKIVKATVSSGSGDIEGVTAGTGLSGGGTTGTVTLNVEAAQPGITSLGTLTGLTIDGNKNVTPGDGAMLHIDASTITDNNTSASGTAAQYNHVHIEASTLAATNASVTTTDAAVLKVGRMYAGTNQTITNPYSILAAGAIGCTGLITSDYEQIAGDMTLYDATNDGNPTFSIGSSATERLEIKAEYESGAQGLDVVKFITHTAGSSSDDARYSFQVDESFIFKIKDNGVQLKASGHIEIGDGNTILSDSSGTTTLNNIDALDATTEATIESAIDTLSNLTTVGTIGTGVWEGTAISNLYTSASGKRYGNYIKILPSDFTINDDAASPLSFKDGSNSGLHVNDSASEAIAFVTIPEGMKATHVDIYGTHNKTIKVWEVDVDSSFDFTSTTKGTGAMNTTLDITDVNATADNYLAIQVTLTATSQRIWGGKVTIAAQ